MKKRMLIAAAVAAMTVSGGAWAACTADIDMGNNKIQNLATPMADSDAATKAYVDAMGQLEVSPISKQKVDGFSGAVQFCRHLNDAGTAVEASAVNAGWRLPKDLSEASRGFHHYATTVDIASASYVASTPGGPPNEFNSIWVAKPVTDGSKPTNDAGLIPDSTESRWFRARLDGIVWGYAKAKNQNNFSFCVR